jgi:hypothetical protein
MRLVFLDTGTLGMVANPRGTILEYWLSTLPGARGRPGCVR